MAACCSLEDHLTRFKTDTRPYSVHRDYYRMMGSQDPVLAADKANVTEASVRGLGVHVYFGTVKLVLL
ncbi:unnamed protein product [Prunus armeniaca]|uniref:Uncharacterized protein n=1 Tax=Prunus armeniaca TaxID=36596 RepID=A0A6J5TWF2_PRUAR|nr:unnamed protein product [Prunus armeniaca]